MKRQKSSGLRLGKLVHQLPGVVTFAYDLRFRHTISRWKGISEDYTFRCYLSKVIPTVASPKKRCLGPQNALSSQGPENWGKNCQNEPVGMGGMPPTSIWITDSVSAEIILYMGKLILRRMQST